MLPQSIESAPLCKCGCGLPAKHDYRKGHQFRRPLVDRFWEKVDKHGPIPNHRPELGACWMWTGCIVDGYGAIGIDRHARKAHRVSWELHVGLIPSGVGVLHQCDNPSCVRPDHLFLGNHTANMRDAAAKGRFTVQGEANPRAKLTAADIPIIRQRRANGERYADIAADYPVSHGAIWYAANGITWTTYHN